MTNSVTLGFGSDIGDGEANIRQAMDLLTEGGFAFSRVSSFIVTAPVNCVEGTPDFTNCCAIGQWDGTPEELLALTQSVEVAMGRPKEHSSREARIIDIDILTFGDVKMDTPGLTIPHPRMHEREFVQIPLKEITN